MTTEEMLIGWLVMLLHQDPDEAVALPTAVISGLFERGWLEKTGDEWNGNERVLPSDLGQRVADLAAPEWWIDPVGAA